MSTTDGHHDVPYEETTDDSYSDAFAGSAQATRTRRGMRIDGTCPRCAWQMSYPLVDSAFRSPLPPGAPVPATGATVVPVLCTCPKEHANRPDGEPGCGAYWNITLGTST